MKAAAEMMVMVVLMVGFEGATRRGGGSRRGRQGESHIRDRNSDRGENLLCGGTGVVLLLFGHLQNHMV